MKLDIFLKCLLIPSIIGKYLKNCKNKFSLNDCKLKTLYNKHKKITRLKN